MDMRAETQSRRYRVEGMDCAACAATIEAAVRKLPGVATASVSATAGTMSVSLSEAAGDGVAIERQVRALGYGIAALEGGRSESRAVPDRQIDLNVVPHQEDDRTGHSHAEEVWSARSERPWWHGTKVRLALASAVALALAYLVVRVLPAADPWAYLGALLIGLVPVGGRALAAAKAGVPFSIESLMTIAAVGAVLIGATEEAAVVVLLFLIGEILEGYAAGRARAGIRSLIDLVPRTAQVERNGNLVEVAVDALDVGDIILVRPGERLAADGILAEGSGALDEAPVTGESTPKEKSKGDPVFAGSISVDAALRVEVTRVGADNTIARVVRLVEEAQEAKAPTERFIDRFSKYYTPAVLALVALVAVAPPLALGADWIDWIYRGLAVLLIGCPCALVISTPAAIAAGLSAGTRRGLLMKGGAVLETVGRLELIAFDKTGTLTEGRPRVTDIVPLACGATDVLRLAAALEAGSSHPFARAVLDRVAAESLTFESATSAKGIAGKGVSGEIDGTLVVLASIQSAPEFAAIDAATMAKVEALNDDGKSVSVLIAGGRPAGLIAVRDELRPDALEGIADLKSLGIGAIMLTGDNRQTATAVARELGMEVRSELVPEEKLDHIRDMKCRGAKVGKVGDGINDAPALAAADIGIAMGGGTDVALETADAAILNGRITDIARMVELSRQTMANIWQNIVISLGLKGVFLVTTILGVTGLWPAILADTGATVLVTLNALRLLGAGRT
jgi:Cd2+/Zn2+-exporting ATPase